MSVAVQWQRSASKATSPFGQKDHLVNNDDTRDRAKEDPLKRRSAPSGGVSANEFQTNLPSRPQLPPILNQRQRSPLRYASLHKIGLNSRYSAPKSYTICSKVTEEKPSVFNPEPVPFTTGRLRCSTVLKKIPIIRHRNDGLPYGVYCSQALLSRTKGFVVRATGRQQCDETKDPKSYTNSEQPMEDFFSSFLSSPNKSKVPFFHASRALITDPPGSCFASKEEGGGVEQSQCHDDTLDMRSTNEDDCKTMGVSPLNEADDLPLTDVHTEERQVLPHEGTSIYWPPPPPPVSTDPTMLSAYSASYHHRKTDLSK